MGGRVGGTRIGLSGAFDALLVPEVRTGGLPCDGRKHRISLPRVRPRSLSKSSGEGCLTPHGPVINVLGKHAVCLNVTCVQCKNGKSIGPIDSAQPTMAHDAC